MKNELFILLGEGFRLFQYRKNLSKRKDKRLKEICRILKIQNVLDLTKMNKDKHNVISRSIILLEYIDIYWDLKYELQGIKHDMWEQENKEG